MTAAEFMKRDQQAAAREEFDQLWREATAELPIQTYQPNPIAYFTAQTLAWKVFVAGKGLK